MLPAAPQTRADLLAWINRDKSLSSILSEARKAEHGDAAHDLSHLLRVALFTMRFAPEADPRECVAAALLHDHVNLPKNHPERARASELSAEAAYPILLAAEFSPPAIERIQGAIRDHSFSRGARPSEMLGQALQDADR
ncbi:MAG: HD domain-containing protein, partial [Proteobacteria bacterium]